MGKLSYAAHGYAWTSSWTDASLPLIDHAGEIGFDVIEVPLMELDKMDPAGVRERAEEVGIGVYGSLALSPEQDITSDDPAVRKAGVDFLLRCVRAAADMGSPVLTGVTYSGIGCALDCMPDERYWKWSAEALKEACELGEELNVTIGIEPVNRYETFLVNTCEIGRAHV